MVAATYVSDLSDIYMWESGSTSDYGGGGSASSAGPDYAIEGTNATAKPVSGSERGFMYDNVSNFTIGADDHFFSWCLCSIPGLMDTRDNRGLVMCIGDDTSNFVKFHLQGNDTLPFGGIQPYAVRFDNTTLANERTLVGTPGTTPSWIGVGSNITGTARFDNTGIDASRIGTGYDILNGTGADPEADFAGIATDDDVAQEGICKTTSGGYNLLGKLRIGSASTACEFLHENANIFIVDSPHALTDFTEVLLEHADSILTLTNINFIALGTNNKGRFEILTSAAVTALTNVGFIDFADTILGSGTTFTGGRWINSGLVTTNGATISGAAVSEHSGTIGMTASSPANAALVSNTKFTSPGTGNGLEITGTAANITLTGLDFTGYSTTVDADKGIYVNIATGSMTINISGGSGITTDTHVRTAGCTITVSADVTVTFDKMKDDTEVRVYAAGTNTELASIEDVTAGTLNNRSFAWAQPAATSVDYVIHHWSGIAPFYKTIRVNGYTVPASNTTIDINQLINRNAT